MTNVFDEEFRATTIEMLLKSAKLVERSPKLAKGSFASLDEGLDENGRWSAALSSIAANEAWNNDDPWEIKVNLRKVCYCTVGAIQKTTGYDMYRHFCIHAIRVFLGLGTEEDVYDWNDEDGRTKEEVVSALRGAAEMLREAGNVQR